MMARSFLVKAVFAVLLALLVTSSQAKRYKSFKSYKSYPRKQRSMPCNTCSKQHECVSVSVNPVAPGPCTGYKCAFEACLTLNTGYPCDRMGGQIAGSCSASRDQCCPTSYSSTGKQSGFRQCQIGSPNSTLKFIVGDGKCDGKGLGYSVGGAKVTCGQNSGKSCMRDACAWKVKLPSCPKAPRPPPPAQLPTCARFGPGCIGCKNFKCKLCDVGYTLFHNFCLPCPRGCDRCKKVFHLAKPVCVLCANQGVVDQNVTSATFGDCVGGTPPPGGVGAVGRRLSEFQTVDLLL